ncbi:MAG: AAA family ATPase [Desulfovibrionaceae bacterium]
MRCTIAVAGKGGVGKTTLSALLVSRLIARGKTPVLAVDADPNSCLDATLGVRAERTIGSVREDARTEAQKGMAVGMSKQQYLELRIAESLVESRDFDLIAMGRPEGPGCYCYANNVLKDALAQIVDNYPYVVIDNEAGLENLSRRLVPKTDVLVLVADPSRRGLETMARLHALALEMGIAFKQLALVVNRLRGAALPPYARELHMATGAAICLGLPENAALSELDEAGIPLTTLAPDNPLAAQIDTLLDLIGPM